MTDVSHASRSLPLQDSTGRKGIWLIVLVFGIPVLIMVGILANALVHNAPTGPVLLTGAFVVAISAVVTLWLARTIGRIAVALDSDQLIVDAGIVTRRFPLSTLRVGGLRIVNLHEHVELKPVVRTWGIGMPGLAAGWFRLRNGAKALCILTGRERITVLRADDGTCVMLSLVDSSPLRSALEQR